MFSYSVSQRLTGIATLQVNTVLSIPYTCRHLNLQPSPTSPVPQTETVDFHHSAYFLNPHISYVILTRSSREQVILPELPTTKDAFPSGWCKIHLPRCAAAHRMVYSHSSNLASKMLRSVRDSLSYSLQTLFRLRETL